jgi:hypothetical protein
MEQQSNCKMTTLKIKDCFSSSAKQREASEEGDREDYVVNVPSSSEAA